MLEKMLHHKLLKEGERGQGVVTKRHDQGSESSNGVYSILFEIQGHIKFPDGTETRFRSEMLSSHKVGDIQEGSIVPVRYDASNHSKVVIDVLALEQAKHAQVHDAEAYLERRKAQAIAEADAKLAQGNATPPAGGTRRHPH
jgi:hypothetical protein